jgi:outer membrane receptor for ferrienterochelin and colicins
MSREQYSLFWEADWNLGKSTVGIHHIESENLGRSLPLSAEQRQLIKDNKRTASNPTGTWVTLADAMADPRFQALMPRPKRTLESSDTTYSAKYEVPLSNHFLVVGAEYKEAELKDGVFGMDKGKTDGKKDYYQYGLFTEDNWNIIDPLTLTFGARYDKHEDFGDNVSPRVYATYAINNNWTVKGGVATGYKTPKTTDLQEGIVGFGGQGTSPQIGNPNLKPEKSVSYEAAVYYEHENGHNANLTLFQNDFKDKIESGTLTGTAGSEWASLGYDDLTQKQNIDDATIKGIEVAGKYFIIDNLSIKANWTYLDSENKETKKPLRSSPKHMYNTTLDYQATSKFNTYLQYSGELDRYNKTASEGANKDIYYKDYSIWNLGATYKVDKNLTFNGRVNNLFDKDFMEYKAVAKGSGRTPYYYDQYSNISAGRNFWLSANYTF